MVSALPVGACPERVPSCQDYTRLTYGCQSLLAALAPAAELGRDQPFLPRLTALLKSLFSTASCLPSAALSTGGVAVSSMLL